MSHCDGAQGKAKMAKITQILVTFPPEKLKPKTKRIFFICSSRLAESVEGLNSYLAQSPGELWLCKIFRNYKNVSQV